MSLRLDRRLAVLETIWQGPATVAADDARFLRWWSRPTYDDVIWQFCMKRAEERYIAARGHYGEHSHRDPGWYTGLSDDERTARAQFELGELDRLQAALGAEAGYRAWHAQADAWPQRYGAVDATALDRRLRDAWENADANRAANPIFARTWPELRRHMGVDEHLVFDDLLIADEARVERVLAGAWDGDDRSTDRSTARGPRIGHRHEAGAAGALPGRS